MARHSSRPAPNAPSAHDPFAVGIARRELGPRATLDRFGLRDAGELHAGKIETIS